MPKTVWRNGAPSTRNPPKDALEWTTDAGMCTKINIVINPQCMRESYGSRFMRVLCVYISVTTLPATYLVYTSETKLLA